MTTPNTNIHLDLPCPASDLAELIPPLLQIRASILESESRLKAVNSIHPVYQKSARNLVQYLALRRFDLRSLQVQLTDWGLSSLARPERKVQASLDNLLFVMNTLAGKKWTPAGKPLLCFDEGRQLLEEHTAALLGQQPPGHRTRIMVTMPTEAAKDYQLVHDLMEGGMNCARINCAHDGPFVWEGIIANIRKAEATTGHTCKILMDLAGPKLRTGPLPDGPPALKVRPGRNDLGEVLKSSQIWLYPEGTQPAPPAGADAILPVPGGWFAQCKKGDHITLRDARGSNRRMRISGVYPLGCWAAAKKTIYFTPGLKLELKRKGEKLKNAVARLAGEMPRRPGSILLHTGDPLILTRSAQPGHAAWFDENDNFHPATIGCSIPDVLDDVKEGEPIWFDDGKIGGIIEGKEPGQVLVRITHAGAPGTHLRAEKGINLPDSDLRLTALTDEDFEALEFAVGNADMVGLSFANRPSDVEALIRLMRGLQNDKPHNLPGIVLKIETNRGFEHLPAMVLTAMQTPLVGVMIARGDLAIECGFGRLAELQEEILWICEAAHLPVIWATQVLEGMAKQGLPTRAEVTDAAMGQRAECIMLNKGPHIVDATKALGNILDRMQDHQTKKRSLLRKLALAEKFFGEAV
ncbi:MAG: pyruvate kinase [Saprospiraceae bacterium]|nr:MAG: pyruvate kinase [Saprospiraceae bacterium]